MILHSKVLCDGLGWSGRAGNGNSRPHSNQQPSMNQRLYDANIVIFLDRSGKIDVLKNRWGPHGKEVNTDDLIEILCIILAEHLFKGIMKLFQEGMKEKLMCAMKKIIKKESSHDTV